MELEERYVIFKLKRMTKEERDVLDQFIYLNNLEEACFVPAVVIEKDWPEYDPTVNLLWERINEL